MIENVRLPRLLRPALRNGAFLETGRLRPAALSAVLNLVPLSTADMTLNEDDLPVQIHDLVELYGQNGSFGIFRVANISTTYGNQRKIRANHALDVFNDAVIPGEEPITGTMAHVLAQLVAAQTATLNGTPYWQLGRVDDTATYTIDNKFGNALDALKKIAEDESDYYFDFDFSTFPWTLNFLQKTNAVFSEFRLPRNVENCQVTLDDSEMCTRLYLSVDTTTTDANGEKTVTTHEIHNNNAAQAVWGVISKTEGIRTEDVPDKAAWVQRYFARNAQPIVQITINGLELNRLTGEPLDAMRIGALCRVALPEYSEAFSERIVSLSYPDLVRAPRRVTVSLANKKPNSSKSFSSLSGRTAANASAASKNSKEIQKNKYSWKVADKHITDIGTILHAAGLEIDPHGVWLYASEDGPNYALGASFKVQADNIAAEVTRATAAEGTMTAQLNVQAGQISSKVSQTDYNGNTIASLINQTATTILIQAARINLSGYVTASALDAQIAQLSSAIAQNITTNRFSCVHGSADYMTVYNTLTLGGGEGGGANVGSAIAGIGTASESGGQITIPTTTLTGSAGPSINFNIADTQFYRNAVASAETNGWNAARARVAPPSAGTGTSFTVDVPSATQGQTQTYTFTIQKGATPGTSGYASVALGQSVVGRISIGDWYSAGYSAGFTAGQSAGESIGYTRGWNAAEAQYSAASYARKNLNRYGHAELYVKERETYYSAGNHYWYWSGSDGWDTLYTKSSS